jgi:hypothetical protein
MYIIILVQFKRQDWIVTGVPVGTRELNTSNLSGVDFSVGAMYQTKSIKNCLFSSISYKLESDLTSTQKYLSRNYNANFNFTTVDSEDQVK